jgi:hypothetical protein
MTTASKLKSAAVVEGEVERKTSETRAVEAVSKTAADVVTAASFKSGSTTATATRQVAFASAKKATSGSRAATNLRAAAKRATRLSASIFPQISNTQRIQYPLGQIAPEGFLRAGCAS